jgi:S-adenosyl-L-methionine hydrolase (adenosine-forming)
MAQAPPTIVFLSDYGHADPFVGLCHAVIAALAPRAHVVDLTHAVGRQHVREGATLLADCLPWLPDEAVLLAVVDPGVGTQRRGVIVAAGPLEGPRLLVGPDNGLLVPAAEALGGATAAWRLSRPPGAASTFDGRDVFAPAAARLALGTAPDVLGEPIAAAGLERLALPGARTEAGLVAGEIVHVDGFGNLQLSAPARLLDEAGIAPGAQIELRVGSVVRTARVVGAFAELPPDRLGVLPDAFHRLQVAVNRGNAARLLGADVGDPVVVRLTGARPPRG